MHELPPSDDRVLAFEEGEVRVYAEPYLDGVLWIADSPLQIMREYPDGSRSYTNKRSGEQTTYYPDNTYTLDCPGYPTIHGVTQFDTTELY